MNFDQECNIIWYYAEGAATVLREAGACVLDHPSGQSYWERYILDLSDGSASVSTLERIGSELRGQADALFAASYLTSGKTFSQLREHSEAAGVASCLLGLAVQFIDGEYEIPVLGCGCEFPLCKCEWEQTA